VRFLTLLSLVTWCIRHCIRLHDGEHDLSNPARGPTVRVFTGNAASQSTRRKKAMKFSGRVDGFSTSPCATLALAPDLLIRRVSFVSESYS
jgi:hypothetical protein